MRMWIACVLLAAVGAEVSAEPRQITVDVVVMAPNQTLVPNAGVQARSAHGFDFAMTNEQGLARLTFDLHEADTEIVVRLWNGQHHELDPELFEIVFDRYNELRDSYAFEPYYTLTPQHDVNEYAFTINLWPAVTVTLTAIDAQGAPVDAGGAVRHSLWLGSVGSIGDPLVLRGVRRGHEADVFLIIESDQMHPIHLAAAQTADDIDLGQVLVIDKWRSAFIDFTMTDALGLRNSGRISLWHWATLIPVGGGPLVTLHLDAQGRAVDVLSEELVAPVPPARLPAGTYYIAPGGITPDVSMALWDMVRQERFAELDAAGVPKVTCVPGETATITINARDARDAIYAATGGP